MRFIKFLLILLIVCSSCYSQSDKKDLIEHKFINKFIDDNNSDIRYFNNNTLLVLGCGVDFIGNKNIKVKFINLGYVSKQIESVEKFGFVSLEKPYITKNKYIKTSFSFFLAIKNKDSYKIVKEDNSTSDYCIFLNHKTKEYRTKWCGQKKNW